MNKETAANLGAFITRFKNEQPLYELSEELTLMPYTYNKAISDFINFCSRERLVRPDCYEITEELIANKKNDKWFANLNEQQVLQCIGTIIRQDRFIDGFIGQTIEDQTMIRLLNRIKLLNSL